MHLVKGSPLSGQGEQYKGCGYHPAPIPLGSSGQSILKWKGAGWHHALSDETNKARFMSGVESVFSFWIIFPDKLDEGDLYNTL